jgi:hypothetical protein
MLSPSPNYLLKRCHAYYYRRRIPRLLRPLFGRKEFIISLQTPHLTDAKKTGQSL